MPKGSPTTPYPTLNDKLKLASHNASRTILNLGNFASYDAYLSPH